MSDRERVLTHKTYKCILIFNITFTFHKKLEFIFLFIGEFL